MQAHKEAIAAALKAALAWLAVGVSHVADNITLIGTTTTVYLVAYATFTTNTMAAYGAINCLRWH